MPMALKPLCASDADMTEYKERHVYFFQCEECHSPRRCSFRRKVARTKLCRKCRRNRPNENQQTLFTPAPVVNEEIKHGWPA